MLLNESELGSSSKCNKIISTANELEKRPRENMSSNYSEKGMNVVLS
jgi:hypothetical protein